MQNKNIVRRARRTPFGFIMVDVISKDGKVAIMSFPKRPIRFGRGLAAASTLEKSADAGTQSQAA